VSAEEVGAESGQAGDEVELALGGQLAAIDPPVRGGQPNTDDHMHALVEHGHGSPMACRGEGECHRRRTVEQRRVIRMGQHGIGDHRGQPVGGVLAQLQVE
jgi:hypothetical protein